MTLGNTAISGASAPLNFLLSPLLSFCTSEVSEDLVKKKRKAKQEEEMSERWLCSMPMAQVSLVQIFFKCCRTGTEGGTQC